MKDQAVKLLPGRTSGRSPAPAPAADLLQHAGEAAEFLRSLAQEHRLAILCALEEGECSVGELSQLMGLAQPNVSQHLARLKAQGLVKARRSGTTIHYAAASPPAAAIVRLLKREFCPPSGEGSGTRRKSEKKLKGKGS